MATWTTTIDTTSSPGSSYRVEHHEDGRVRTLGVVTGVPPHHSSLEPYVTGLLHDGNAGLLLLIDEATGAVVARRRVRPYGLKPRQRFLS